MNHHPVLRAATHDWLVAHGFTPSGQLEGWWHRGRLAIDASYLSEPVCDVEARPVGGHIRLLRVPLEGLPDAVERIEAALRALHPRPGGSA